MLLYIQVEGHKKSPSENLDSSIALRMMTPTDRLGLGLWYNYTVVSRFPQRYLGYPSETL